MTCTTVFLCCEAFYLLCLHLPPTLHSHHRRTQPTYPFIAAISPSRRGPITVKYRREIVRETLMKETKHTAKRTHTVIHNTKTPFNELIMSCKNSLLFIFLVRNFVIKKSPASRILRCVAICSFWCVLFERMETARESCVLFTQTRGKCMQPSTACLHSRG